MTHFEKTERLIRELTGRGVSEYTAAPRAFRFLWRRGILVPPPLFIPFRVLAPLAAIAYALVMLAAFCLLALPVLLIPDLLIGGQLPVGPSIRFLLKCNVAVGIVGGPFIAAYYRYLARKLGLPAWSDYGTHCEGRK